MSQGHDQRDDGLEERLDGWGAEERRDLDEALALRGVPGEEQVGATLRQLAQGTPEPVGAGFSPGRWVALAAATVLVAFSAWWWQGSSKLPEDRGPVLGTAASWSMRVLVEADAPTRFRWSFDGLPDGWFVVEVFDLEDGAGEPALVSPELEEALWVLSPEEEARRPERFRWVVRALAPGTTLGSAEAVYDGGD